ARRPLQAGKAPRDEEAPALAQALGTGSGLRRRARARLARADDDRTPARDPELDDVRLRVRMAAAPARLPRRDEGRRPRRDPGGTAGAVQRPSAEAPPVPRSEGGVLPRRLRAGPRRARPARRRSRARARRAPPAARRLALPPSLESAVSADGRLSRPSRRGAGGRVAADRGAARIRPRSRPACARTARAS